LVGSADDQDFSAVMFGDCTGNWHPSAAGVGAAFEASASSAPQLRLGLARRGRGGRVRFPLFIESPESFHAFDARISFDPGTFRLVAARPVNTARNALVQYNSNVAGVVMLALASTEPIAHDNAPFMVLDFQRRRSGRFTPPHVRSASVDERPAAVSAGD
jgi:hypothetical protein